MKDFARWLVISNGLNMLSAIGNQNVTKEQFRSAVITHCILFEIEVDTNRWDELIAFLYDSYNSWFSNCDEFDLYMSELLV